VYHRRQQRPGRRLAQQLDRQHGPLPQPALQPQAHPSAEMSPTVAGPTVRFSEGTPVAALLEKS
jgi:hypothetical protein